MDARTLEALKASIAKWERNAVAARKIQAHVFGDSCPLCKLFPGSQIGNCKGCPVFERTLEHGCKGSPWFRAAVARNDWVWGSGKRSTFHAAAREEVDFLKSLLPPEEAP